MQIEVKIFNINEIVRKTVSGDLDVEQSMQIARDTAAIAFLHKNHNILMDLRKTSVKQASLSDLMKIALEIVNGIPDFQNKIASLIPDDPERVTIARQFKSCLILKGFQYEIFTDFEKAIEWLSETITKKKIHN